MEFCQAARCDLSELMALYRAASGRMDEQGVSHWDEIYPSEEIIGDDIDGGLMTLGKIDGVIAVAFALEHCCHGDYERAAWRYAEPRFVVLHRLCVHPAFQGRGIARQAMDYLEAKTVRARQKNAIRLDAFSQNPAALHLYESRGYEKAGRDHLSKRIVLFTCTRNDCIHSVSLFQIKSTELIG